MTTHMPEITDPVGLLESLPRRPSQRPAMRRYQKGYEDWMGLLPVIQPGDAKLAAKKGMTHAVMSNLSTNLLQDNPPWLKTPRTEFERSILAIERRMVESEDDSAGHTLATLGTPNSPTVSEEGVEILVAHWPKGFTSPVHGHAPGYLYEQVLEGKILVNTYRPVTDKGATRVVRPVFTEIQEFPNMLVSDYVNPDPEHQRIGYVHSFTALTPVSTLHFLPEHTRDSRDNTVTIEHFADLSVDDVTQLSYRNADMMIPGDVALVRSERVTDYGDHFIVIIGKIVEKPHGFRQQERVIQADAVMSKFLDKFTPEQGGLRLLRLKDEARDRFLQFHGIEVDGLKVKFPKV